MNTSFIDIYTIFSESTPNKFVLVIGRLFSPAIRTKKLPFEYNLTLLKILQGNDNEINTGDYIELSDNKIRIEQIQRDENKSILYLNPQEQTV